MVRLLLSLAILLANHGFSVSARVNGEPISDSEVKHFERAEGGALDRAILFRLAIQDAKKKGLEKRPLVKEQIERALYQNYLTDLLASPQAPQKPSARELEEEYNKNPLLRLRHLVLLARTQEEKQASEKLLEEVQTRLKNGQKFEQLVLKYSQDDSAKLGGDLDFQSREGLPTSFYEAGLTLKQGEVSAPLPFENALHLVQLMDRKPFASAPASYLAELQSKMIARRQESFLSQHLETLRRRARVEISKEKKPQ